MIKRWTYFLICSGVIFSSCKNSSQSTQAIADSLSAKGTYAYDVAFLKKYVKNLVELSDESGQAKVLLSADYQGRVMTSTATGDTGLSFGWINYDLIAASEKKKQFNPIGGEERFWMGPEGGQYSIYFKPGDSFNITHWQVPAIIDTLAYDLQSSDRGQASFSKQATVTNFSNTPFNITIERGISLISRANIQQRIGTSLPASVQAVGYESNNQIINSGADDWKKEKGLLSVWLLGMFTPTPETVVIIPFRPIPGVKSFITDNYFGTVPSERLNIKDSVLIFTCDGKYRSKIGLSPLVAKPLACSYDFKNNVLTIVIPAVEEKGLYVNSKWEIQKEPYKGDVINSYNDGPLQDGSQLGPFYEIESSSPAKELKKGERLEYRQFTCHLQGDYTTMREIVRKLLSVDLDEIKR